jgi:hypothetical protein
MEVREWCAACSGALCYAWLACPDGDVLSLPTPHSGSEVYCFQRRVLAVIKEKEVFWFAVPPHDAVIMQLGHRLENAPHDARRVCLAVVVADMLPQLAPWGVTQHAMIYDS